MSDWTPCGTDPASSWADGQPEPASTFDECGVAPDSTWNLCRAGGAGTHYTVARSSSSPVVANAVTITAQLVDVLGAPVLEAGHVVTWGKTGAGGTFAVPSTITDDNGQAVVAFTVGTLAAVVNTVTATDEVARTGVSGAITTQPDVAVALDLATAPAGAVGDVALTTQPRIRFLDLYGNITTGSAAISATVDVGTLTGAGPITPVGNVATFIALTFVDIPLVRAGTRVLTFTAPGMAPVSAAPLLVALGNDMVAWFRGDDVGNAVDANAPPHLVSAFDRSGHGNTSAATGTILQKTGLQNAKTGFDFATAGLNYLADLALGVQGSFTWFGVFKVVSSVTYQNLFDTASLPTTWLFWDQPANGWQVGDRIAGTLVAGSYVTLVVHFLNNGAQIQVVVRANGVSLMNSFLTAPGALLPGSSGSPVNKTFQQFHRAPNLYSFTSQLMEWGFFSKHKNGAEASLESYLRTEYATW